jgi:hypothetical protein
VTLQSFSTFNPQQLPSTDPGLYVCRSLINWKQLQRWAEGTGFDLFQAASFVTDYHTTIVCSRRYVDLGDPHEDNLVVDPSAFVSRIEFIGEKKDIVLKFASPELWQRWIQASTLGATWDFPTYVPHVTLAYPLEGKTPVLPQSAPTFPLIFGPEVFSDLAK